MNSSIPFKRDRSRPPRSPASRLSVNTKFRHVGSHLARGSTSALRKDRDENDATAMFEAAYHDLDETKVDEDEAEEDGDNQEDDSFDWNEPNTMVELLEGSFPFSSPQSMALSKIDDLQPALHAAGPELTQDIVYTIVPIVKRVQEVYDTMQTKIDYGFGAGIVAFDTTCQLAEKASLKEEDELKRKMNEHQEMIKRLNVALEEEYSARNKLWEKYKESATRIVERTKTTLIRLPDEVEERITHWEKKSKDLEKEDKTSIKASQNMLSSLLGNIS